MRSRMRVFNFGSTSEGSHFVIIFLVPTGCSENLKSRTSRWGSEKGSSWFDSISVAQISVRRRVCNDVHAGKDTTRAPKVVRNG